MIELKNCFFRRSICDQLRSNIDPMDGSCDKKEEVSYPQKRF